MKTETFHLKMKELAHTYFYKSLDSGLTEKVEVDMGYIEAVNLMVITLAENGFDKGIFQFKNYIEPGN